MCFMVNNLLIVGAKIATASANKWHLPVNDFETLMSILNPAGLMRISRIYLIFLPSLIAESLRLGIVCHEHVALLHHRASLDADSTILPRQLLVERRLENRNLNFLHRLYVLLLFINFTVIGSNSIYFDSAKAYLLTIHYFWLFHMHDEHVS